MNKKIVILSSLITVLTLSIVTIFMIPQKNQVFTRGSELFHITLDSNSGVEEKDEGYFHQVNVKENKIDMIGYSSEGGNFGSIKKAPCGDFTYNGMIFNQSVINGFSSLTVNFLNGTLHYVFTDFLMENMNFDSTDTLVSGESVSVPAGKAYFLIYNESTTPVNIDSIDVAYYCDSTIDNTMIFNKESQMGSARSNAKRSALEDSFVELENNPTKNNNNYSTGSYGGHNASWYRWNGRYFANSANLGTDFTFGLTVMGDFSRVVDTSKNFHYAVWPQFNYAGSDLENLNDTYVKHTLVVITTNH